MSHAIPPGFPSRRPQHVFWPQSDPEPQRPHDSDEDHYRTVGGIPFERIVIDPRALTMAADSYEAFTGHVDEIALGHAVLTYLESAEAQ